MNVLEGLSNHRDAVAAVNEAISQWAEDASPDILFVFHSSIQDSHIVAATLADRFPDTLMVGCTTAGEWITGQHQRSALVLLAISTPEIRWAVAVFEGLDTQPVEGSERVCADLLCQLDLECSSLNAKDYFCLSFMDGLSYREESVIAAMSSKLGDVPLLGGSAGDDLKFEHAFVMANGRAYQNAAVFVLAESKMPFRAIKHQHYVPGDIDVVITKADVEARKVYRLDGMPAAQRYAQLLGLDVEALTPAVFSDHPLIYLYDQECYVRALRQVCEDDSLEFGCAIEEGMILNLCEHQNMSDKYDQLMSTLQQDMGKVSVLLLCNCIYRALEGDDKGINQTLAEKTAAIADHVIGFDTYGEQWQGLHVNQTLVGLALGSNE